jgi:alpha-tubulin suppressor-like RCC1 family protein/pimeloyl-ACP methyl ester carboxylesterase
MGYNEDGELGDGTTTSKSSPVQIVSSGVIAISAGESHSLFIKTDGSLWAMGYNSRGQLGDGSTISKRSPVQIVTSGVTAISAGGAHSLFLMNDGSLWAMGYNTDGQLGDGTTDSQNSPVQIMQSGVTAISAGDYHSLFLMNDGSLWALGRNSYGQLGDGTTALKISPLEIVPSGVTAISGGGSHSLFLMNDGSLWGMGYNEDGELGDGTFTSKSSPVQITPSGVVAISAGNSHSLYLTGKLSVKFNDGANGTVAGTQMQECNYGEACSTVTAVPTAGYHFVNWTKGGVSYGTTAALTVTNVVENMVFTANFASNSNPRYTVNFIASDNGSIEGMASQQIYSGESATPVNAIPYTDYHLVNWFGTNGFATTADNPLTIANVTADLSVTANFASDSIPKCTVSFITEGNNGSIEGATSQAIYPNGFGTTVKAVPNTGFHFVNWTINGVVYSSNATLTVTNAQDMTVTANFAINTGLYRLSFMVSPANCRNINPTGSIGVNPGEAISISANAAAGYYFMDWKITAGTIANTSSSETTVSLVEDATVTANFTQNPQRLFGMGGNIYGQLGLNDRTRRNIPEQAAGGVISVSTGYDFSLFLKSNGSLWGMGLDYYGELGLGETPTVQITPVQIMSSGIVAISAGWAHSMVLKEDGSLWAMGLNNYGQLGDGTTTDRHAPVKIASSGITAISAGEYHSLFLKNDGSMWAMGSKFNNYGVLGGDEDADDYQNTPVQLASGVTTISSGAYHSLFMKEGGSLWGMGYNESGQLGDGTTINRYSPVQIMSSGVIAISGGYYHSLFLKSNGSLWAMGHKANYCDPYLGDGTIPFQSIPVQIVSSGVTAISAGFDFSLFMGNGISLDMIPDWNRDGVIDANDKGKVTSNTPWRFWINDDDDSDADADGTGGDDLPGQLDEDRSDNIVNGIRDLVDFFPVFVDLKNTLEILPSSEYTYRLKQADSALAGFETEIQPASANEYLQNLEETEKYKNSGSNLIKPDGSFILTDAFLNKIKTENKGILLLEGRAETTAPLILEVVRKSDNNVVSSREMPLSISGVEKMFRHKNLRDVAVGGNQSGANSRDDTYTARNYPESMDKDSYLVWVHGYSNDGDEARATYSEIFKRLFWSGYKGKFYPISWNGDPLATLNIARHYHNSTVNAFATADDLALFVNGLSVDGSNVCVVGHSLGNMVVGSAINDHAMRCTKYFAIDAAVALEAYNESEPREDSLIAVGDDGVTHLSSTSWTEFKDAPYNKLMSSEWYRLFEATSDNRKDLTWRGRFKNVGIANGPALYNFFSSTEEVLRKYDGNSIDDGSNGLNMNMYCWGKQEKFKGTETWFAGFGGGTSEYCGWGFNLEYSPYYNTFWYELWLNKDMKLPAELGDISGFDLIHHPFFKPNPSQLFEDGGSDFVNARVEDQPVISNEWKVLGDVKVRDWLLAKAFPALTLPAGANKLGKIGGDERNFDMPSLYKTDSEKWPTSRNERINNIDVKSWWHSDYKDIAYQHVYLFYKKIVYLTEN